MDTRKTIEVQFEGKPVKLTLVMTRAIAFNDIRAAYSIEVKGLKNDGKTGTRRVTSAFMNATASLLKWSLEKIEGLEIDGVPFELKDDDFTTDRPGAIAYRVLKDEVIMKLEPFLYAAAADIFGAIFPLSQKKTDSESSGG